MKKTILTFLLGFFGLLLVLATSTAAQVHPAKLNKTLISKSIQEVWGANEQPRWRSVIISDSTAKLIKGELRAKAGVADTVHIGTITTDEGTQYILPDIAPSRSEKFTYLLYFDASKKITGIDVLDYRENYGYEIDYSYFRDQFKGKKEAKQLRFRRSIQNISGATISARSITNSVHDLLLIINQITLPR